MSLNDDSRPNTPPQSTSNIQKADQIASRFFIKFLLILVAARSTAIEQGPRSAKVDKWFNLETPDTDIHRDHMRAFRAISTLGTPPTLTLHVVLTIPELGANQALVAVDAFDARLRMEPTPRAILLETWTLSVSHPAPGSASLSSSDSGEISIAAVYKHAISLFRALYTLCRQLPAARLYQKYRQRVGVPLSSQAFGIELRLQVDASVLTLDASPSPVRPTPLPTSTYPFPPLATPLGPLRISVRYLTRPNFRIDTLESLISSRFFHQDSVRSVEESVAFTPTVQAHRARDSAASSPSGVGVAIRGSRQPVPLGTRHTRTISFPATSSGAAVSLPRQSQDHPTSNSGSASDRSMNAAHLVPNASGNNSPRVGGLRQESLAFVTPGSLGRATPLRTGRESLDILKPGSADRSSPGTSSSPPSNLSRLRPDGARVPSLTPISAFKSSTFASSGLNSPSSSLRSHGIATPVLPRPPSSVPYTIPEVPGAGTSSRPWPSVTSSPPEAGLTGLSSDYPPPFAASTSVPKGGTSVLGGSSPRSTDSTPGNAPPRVAGSKRYSSSFGHRRAPSTGTPASGTGSPAIIAGELPLEPFRPSSTLLDPTEHEGDVSEFLRAIDSARPLRSRNDSHSSSSASSSAIGHVRRVSLAERRQSPLVGKIELPPPSPRSPPARLQELRFDDAEDREDIVRGNRASPLIPSSHSSLGTKLQNMDDQFLKSMQGLRERRRGTIKAGDLSSSNDLSTERQQTDVSGTTRTAPSFRHSIGGTPTNMMNVGGRNALGMETGRGTPGSAASDGFGYADIVGRLDLDSPDLGPSSHTNASRSPFGTEHIRQEFDSRHYPAPRQRYVGAGRETDEVADEMSPSMTRSGSGHEEGYGGESEDAGSTGSEDRVVGGGGGVGLEVGANVGAGVVTGGPKRTSKYTSFLRRDATIRPASTTSSTATATAMARALADGVGSSSGHRHDTPDNTNNTSLSRQSRRSATGWSGGVSPPPPAL
ncbi:hypothetical protein FS842_009378 [Serendipita sp. 407]|nr:hypothetical protein FS842_009378 [Serendipita sp. 407]